MADLSTGIGKVRDEPGTFCCNGSLKNEFARGKEAFWAEKTVSTETQRHNLFFSGVPSFGDRIGDHSVVQARDLGLPLHTSFRDLVFAYFIVFLSCFLSVLTSKYLSVSSNFLYSCQPHCSVSNYRLSWATSVFPAHSSPPCIHSSSSPFHSHSAAQRSLKNTT